MRGYSNFWDPEIKEIILIYGIPIQKCYQQTFRSHNFYRKQMKKLFQNIQVSNLKSLLRRKYKIWIIM